MIRTYIKLLVSSVLFCRLVCPCVSIVHGEEIRERKPWTTSTIKGSPEPPLPYRARRVFPNLGFKNPTVLSSAPGTDRLFVAEQAGKIFSIPNDRDRREGDCG